MTHLVGVRAAADQLGVNASTVSRYLKQHPDLVRGDGPRPMVNVQELREHRARTVNPAMQGNHAGVVYEPDAPERPPPPASAPASPSARSRHDEARAVNAELDLQERLGTLTAVRDVEDALFEAGRTIIEALRARNQDLAAEMATLDDPREIAAALERSDREILSRLAEELNGLVRTDDAVAAA